jgi:hypothetical protein
MPRHILEVRFLMSGLAIDGLLLERRYIASTAGRPLRQRWSVVCVPARTAHNFTELIALIAVHKPSYCIVALALLCIEVAREP